MNKFLFISLIFNFLYAENFISVKYGGEPDLDACGGVGWIKGINKNGDGFVSVRNGPSTKYKIKNKIYKNGTQVFICDDSGKWIGVVYGKDDCDVSSPILKRQSYKGQCRSGWIYGKYVTNSHTPQSSPGQVKQSNTISKAVPSNTFTITRPKSKTSKESAKNTFSKAIIVTGYGVSKEKALKSAFKAAVSQYVGVLVDADTVMKNNKIIKDEILTASNGYIQSYDEISTSKSDGLVEVQIKALVKSQKIFKKVESLNIATKNIVGAKDIQARVITKKTSRDDSQKIFKINIAEFVSKDSIKDMLEVVIKDVKVLEDKTKGNKVPIVVAYQLKFNLKNYETKVKQLEEVFRNLGAVLHKRYDLPYISRYGLESRKKGKSLGVSDSNIGFIKKYGDGYKMDMWELPSYAKVSVRRGYIDALNWEDIFKLILEIKDKNGEVLKAEYIPRLSSSFEAGSTWITYFFKYHLTTRGNYTYGVSATENCNIFAPFFDVYRMGGRSKESPVIDGTQTIWMNISDIDKMSSVVMEIESK